MIRLQGVVAGYGREPFQRPVLRSVDLEVGAGEVVALVGLNGSGKTTLFRVVAGLLPPRGGTVELFGSPPGPYRRKRGIGLLPASVPAPAGWTLRDLLEEGAGRDVRDAPSAAEAAARVGLEGELDRLLSRLSTGQLRRGLLAYALMGAPSVVLLDEPFAGLDVTGRRLLGREVAACREGGAAVMLASHELRETLPLADRVVVLGTDGIATPAAVDPSRPEACHVVARIMENGPGTVGEAPA